MLGYFHPSQQFEKKHERLSHGNKRQRRGPSPQPGPSGLQPGADTRKRQRHDPSSQPGPSTLHSDGDGPQRRRFRAALNTFEVEKIFRTPEVLQDLLLFLNSKEREVTEILEQRAQEKRGIKFYLNCKIRFVREVSETENEYCDAFFRSKNETCLLKESPVEKVKTEFVKIQTSCEEFQTRGSGWVIDAILYLEVNTCTYHPLAASSFIPLPSAIAEKRAVVNIKNTDNKCFLWCVLAALHPATTNPQRVSNYVPFVKTLNVDQITFPTPLSQIDRFEKLNNISINVFGFEREVFPLKITSVGKEKHINLLLISDGNKQHYTLIKNLNYLLNDLTKHNGKKFYCNFCLHRFCTEKGLHNHQLDCRNHKIQKIRMPSEKKKWLQFDKHRFQLPVPYVIYADFECILEKIDTCEMNPHISSTHSVSKHTPCGFAYVVVGPDGEMIRPPTVYRGEGAIIQFFKLLIEEEEWILPKIREVKPMVFTPADYQKFETAINCSICEQPLRGDKVRDHDHLTGVYRGAAKNSCNLNFQIATHIPIIMHNFKNYDSHLIMHEFVRRKGCYPYDYFDSFSKFTETSLPPLSAFFNSLTNEPVSDDDYQYAQRIWNIFNLQTLGDFHDLYVTSDVLLLADVFQNFRKLCLQFYKIDPSHVYTAPGLAWQACLRMTNVKLELLTDIDMHLFVEKGIRGGVAIISHRFASTNNPHLPNYDPTSPNSFIMYWEANNLYGWAMSQRLPTHEFSWSQEPVDYLNIPDDSDEGYILAVDLEYPPELHHQHNCYPLAPEKLL
ncbi:hypothetical protein AVEN_157095-1 [Araneus ventricosus]|uniref:DNA-directed DNA polymerase n=1 Tax=Araneus ventricosus TaxID=182803 RepID=A0A4Y2FV11_ARAVE|nr:hypothetical protein AVEN_157095-1 [Araneus ventricosus]